MQELNTEGSSWENKTLDLENSVMARHCGGLPAASDGALKGKPVFLQKAAWCSHLVHEWSFPHVVVLP